MASIRTQRVSDLVKQEVASLINNGKLRDPRLGYITITDVETSSDLKYCKIYFTVFDDDESVSSRTSQILNRSVRFLRLNLGKVLGLRFVPHLKFILDNSMQYGLKMDKLIDALQIKKQVESTTAAQFTKFLQTNDSFLILSHEDPDGDTIGSAIALHLALKQLGKVSELFCPSRIPEMFQFLLDEEGVCYQSADKLQKTYDAAILVDLNQIERAGNLEDLGFRFDTLAIIDHHISETNTRYDIAFTNFTAAATGILVYQLLKNLNTTLDEHIAKALYVSIVTDTGSFRYSSTSKETFLMAADLISYGIKPWEITENLYESHPRERIEFLSSVLSTLEMNEAFKYASITISQEIFKKHNVSTQQPEVYDGFINFPRSIKGIEVAIQFKEMESGATKISIRSKGTIDVSGFASYYGGGGHKNAAGCLIKEPLAKAKQLFISHLEENIERQWNSINK